VAKETPIPWKSFAAGFAAAAFAAASLRSIGTDQPESPVVGPTSRAIDARARPHRRRTESAVCAESETTCDVGMVGESDVACGSPRERLTAEDVTRLLDQAQTACESLDVAALRAACAELATSSDARIGPKLEESLEKASLRSDPDRIVGLSAGWLGRDRAPSPRLAEASLDLLEADLAAGKEVRQGAALSAVVAQHGDADALRRLEKVIDAWDSGFLAAYAIAKSSRPEAVGIVERFIRSGCAVGRADNCFRYVMQNDREAAADLATRLLHDADVAGKCPGETTAPILLRWYGWSVDSDERARIFLSSFQSPDLLVQSVCAVEAMHRARPGAAFSSILDAPVRRLDAAEASDATTRELCLRVLRDNSAAWTVRAADALERAAMWGGARSGEFLDAAKEIRENVRAASAGK